MQRYPGFDYTEESRKPPESGKIRPFTAWISELVEQCLIRNDQRGKPGWERENVGFLWKKTIEEILELREELQKPEPDPQRIQEEASDAMALLGMIAARMDPEKKNWHRGYPAGE